MLTSTRISDPDSGLDAIFRTKKGRHDNIMKLDLPALQSINYVVVSEGITSTINLVAWDIGKHTIFIDSSSITEILLIMMSHL